MAENTRDVLARHLRPSVTFDQKAEADRILAALGSAGLVVVPVEPTYEMKCAWTAAQPCGCPNGRAGYAAMLAAAP